MSSDDRTFDEEWEKRVLCSDGNCIGVIGPDGRCKECGRPGEDGVVDSDAVETPPDDPPADDSPAGEAPDTSAAAEADAATEPAESSDDDDDWASRQLCPDGNCIGVIGPDGRCKECGRSAE